MATKEFACDKCGTFLDSVDGAPSICRCDGAFHAPAEVEPNPETLPPVLFPDSPPMEPEPEAPPEPKKRATSKRRTTKK